MKTKQPFLPYQQDTQLIVSKDDEGLRIDGYLVTFKEKNGIVVIENGSTGSGHSCHPNIDVSGSVSGMKKLGYWQKDAKVVRANGFYYNTSSIVISDPLDLLAYHMEVNGYRIKQSVIDQCGNPQWGGIAITLPKVEK